MKTAICFYGNPDISDSKREFHNKFIRETGSDCFLFFWKDSNKINPNKLTPEIKSYLKEYDDPMYYVGYRDGIQHEDSEIQALYHHYFELCQVISLAYFDSYSRGIEYDAIIVSDYQNDFNFKLYDVHKHKLNARKTDTGISDSLMIGNSEVMLEFSKIIGNVDAYLHGDMEYVEFLESKSYSDGLDICSINEYHIQKNEISVHEQF